VVFSTYAEFARNQVVRRILLLGLLIRIPLWAAGVVLTLHVVGHLDRSYTQAGLVEMVLCIALAVSGPWRGRRLDRTGLRATVMPSLIVLAVTWSIAPWVGYWALLGFVGLAGLFVVPTFSIVRQVLIGAVPPEQRTAVLSLDSVVVECSFMIGPVVGVLAATYLPTPVALMICQLFAVGGALVLWFDNPPLVSEAEATSPDGAAARRPLREWLTPAVVMIMALSVAATIILTGGDLGTIAAMRAMDHTTSIGWVLALWALGSAIGGIVYGALSRHPPAAVLLVLLGVATSGVALAESRLVFTALLFVSGLFCAPTMTATIDELTRLVPAVVRGEAMGWHGGFELAGALGIVLAAVGLAVIALRGSRGPGATVHAGLDDGRGLESA
jgi:MFS family permease